MAERRFLFGTNVEADGHSMSHESAAQCISIRGHLTQIRVKAESLGPIHGY